MQLYFVRHGQSQNNILWESTGSEQGRVMDPELTEAGRRQAELVAQFLARPGLDHSRLNGNDPQNLAGFGITHVYCSLMVRAVATGMAIASALHLPLHAWEETHEEGGIYLDDENGAPVGQAGYNRGYFEQNFPGLVLPETLGENGWWNRPFEVQNDRRPRAYRFVHDLLARHGRTDDHVVLVSHGGFYNHLLAVLINYPGGNDDLGLAHGPWFVMNNAAVTRIDFRGDHIVLVYQNRVDFLPPELIT